METLSEFLGGRSLHRTFRECNLASRVAAASLARGGSVFTSVSSYPCALRGEGKGGNSGERGGQVL